MLRYRKRPGPDGSHFAQTAGKASLQTTASSLPTLQPPRARSHRPGPAHAGKTLHTYSSHILYIHLFFFCRYLLKKCSYKLFTV